MKIALIGMMGSSKTTSGKELAQLLGYTLVDSDEVFTSEEGNSIANVFISKGEQYFRQKESEILSRMSKLDNIVLSTGGGIVLSEANREELKQFYCVHLSATASTIYSRIKSDQSRPLLNNMSLDKIESIMHERKELYSAVGDITVKTDMLTPGQIANEVLKNLPKN